jgi:hypothetical protein
VRNLGEYKYYEPKEEINHIVREYQRKGGIMYEVALTTGEIRRVSANTEEQHFSLA